MACMLFVELPFILQEKNGLERLRVSPKRIDGLCDIGECLGIGAGLGVRRLPVRSGEADEARQEEKVHLFIEEVQEVPQADLGGEAGLGSRGFQRPVDERPVRPLGQDDPEAELAEEGLPERQIVVDVEHPRDADRRGPCPARFAPWPHSQAAVRARQRGRGGPLPTRSFS